MHIQGEALKKHSITAYEGARFFINQQWHQLPLFVSEKTLLPNPPPLTQSSITSFLASLSESITLLIVGSPQGVHFLTQAQQVACMQAKIGLECMKIDAACRTYNLLLAERRQVGLLLL